MIVGKEHKKYEPSIRIQIVKTRYNPNSKKHEYIESKNIQLNDVNDTSCDQIREIILETLTKTENEK